MRGSNHTDKQIIQMSKRRKGLKIPKVNPDSPTKSVCIKQLSTFLKIHDLTKKSYLLTSLNHCKISAGIMTRNQKLFSCIIIKRQNVLLLFYICIHKTSGVYCMIKVLHPPLSGPVCHTGSLPSNCSSSVYLRRDTGDHGDNEGAVSPTTHHISAKTVPSAPRLQYVKQYTS